MNGLQREKNEEVGENVVLRVATTMSYNAYYVKAGGQHMVLPHYYAEYVTGDIVLSKEYSEYVWVPTVDLDAFGPKVENIPEIVAWTVRIREILKDEDFTEI